MPYKNVCIQMILPNNEVHWKRIFCPKRRLIHNEYCISIELEDKKRQYTCVSFQELVELITKIPIEKRCFYEHISHTDAVKFYLDYEYYNNHQNVIINVNKALSSIQKIFIDVLKIISNEKNISIHDIVILKASSNDKESFHIILDNENIRFSNTSSLYLFVTEVFRIMVLATLQHECIRKKNNVGLKVNNESSLSEVMNVFNSVWLEWFECINCKIKNMEIDVSNVCNLCVSNKEGYIVPCIDMKVYNIEQDFRMFMCTKAGEKRPLVVKSFLEKYESDVIKGTK